MLSVLVLNVSVVPKVSSAVSRLALIRVIFMFVHVGI